MRERNRVERVESLQTQHTGGDGGAFSSMVELSIELAIGLLMEDNATVESIDRDGPFDTRAFDELKRAIAEAIDELPARERLIIRYHYFHFVGLAEPRSSSNSATGACQIFLMDLALGPAANSLPLRRMAFTS